MIIVRMQPLAKSQDPKVQCPLIWSYRMHPPLLPGASCITSFIENVSGELPTAALTPAQTA